MKREYYTVQQASCVLSLRSHSVAYQRKSDRNDNNIHQPAAAESMIQIIVTDGFFTDSLMS